ncbi:hypothetical protein [uncultured Candidatus Puniceispirillum sp.]|jgi:hypothetical protein|uniref:type II secretion system protein n=1 Tax=uncultured Candidatus Puniceispirillum sp. TaxID=1985115 RepID=UPI0032B1BC00
MTFIKNYLHNSNTDIQDHYSEMGLQKRNGFAIISVLVVITLLGAIAVPLLNTVNKSRESAISIRVATHLGHEARENFEIGFHLTKLDGGIPSFFKTGASASVISIGNACLKRINAVDNEYLGGFTIGDPNIRHSPITISNNRKVVTFAYNNGRKTGAVFEELVIISCAMSETGEMGVYAGKLGVIDGSFYPINFGQF